MLDTFVAPYDATIVRKLHAEAGMVMLGKCNMDEFAMGSSNETSYYGPVKNPWDATRVPGGSCGGSVAAVAAGLAPAATATDTGGSIRQPAALTNLTGIKPTYGRVSRYGMIAFASSLDQAGVVARTAEDAAFVLQAMSGFDPRDSTSVERPVDDYVAGLGHPIKGLRVGLPKEYFAEGLAPGARACVAAAILELKNLAPSSRRSRCRTRRCRCRRITSLRRRRRRAISRVLTACATATAPKAPRRWRRCTSAAAAKALVRKCSAAS